MKVVLNYENITLNGKSSRDVFPSEGIFEDEFQNLWFVNDLVIFIGTVSDINIDIYPDAQVTINGKPNQQPESINESTFLKTVAILSGNIKNIEI